MKIQRIGKSYYEDRMTEFEIYVRKDLTVVVATERYYTYVGENSCLPISSLLSPEDGEELLKDAQNFTEPVEYITNFTDCLGGNRNVYIRMEKSSQTEDGEPLFVIKLFDVRDMEKRKLVVEGLLTKYRSFMSLNSEFLNEYYFEYKMTTNQIVVYKYDNERSLEFIKCSLEEFADKMHEKFRGGDEQKEQMKTFCGYLTSGASSFEMEFTLQRQEGNSVCRVKGGTTYKGRDLVVGIMLPDSVAEGEAYYMTPAARDAGTGLFNKKAMTEYVMEKLHSGDNKCKWLILIDIDDFKEINDTFGHLFGDQVIRKVAEILQVNIGYRGVVGRFGGDEFFVFTEKVPDRVAVKTYVKTVAKEMAYAFDPELKVKASIGIVQYPVDGTSYEKLFAKADKALYIAKEKGKNRHIIYDEKQHGELEKDTMQSMTVTYAVSREKRREALIDILSNMYAQGVEYVTEDPKVQKLIRDMYDLDGISIYTDYGRKLVCSSGNYAAERPDISEDMEDDIYLGLFGKEDIMVESTMSKLKTRYQQIYKDFVKQEIGATIQCLARRKGVPFAVIKFDVFNRNRKWSETDIEMLSLIGSCIGKLLSASTAEKKE